MAMRSMVATASTGYCAGGGFRRQHHRVGAFEDGGGDVGDFGPGGHRALRSSIPASGSRPPPACRRGAHARVICFCRPGTFSTGSSTPRSPRATIRASVMSRIPARCSIACGFSILAITAARPRAIFLASAMSSGRWMKDSAIQSTPASSAASRSEWSLAGQRGKRQHGVGQADALARRQPAADLDPGERPLRRRLAAPPA